MLVLKANSQSLGDELPNGMETSLLSQPSLDEAQWLSDSHLAIDTTRAWECDDKWPSDLDFWISLQLFLFYCSTLMCFFFPKTNLALSAKRENYPKMSWPRLAMTTSHRRNGGCVHVGLGTNKAKSNVIPQGTTDN